MSTPYTGNNADTLAIKQNELSFYLQAQQAFSSGVQSYRISNRQLDYMDPSKLQAIINKLMLEIVFLQNGGRRKSFGVIPKDF